MRPSIGFGEQSDLDFDPGAFQNVRAPARLGIGIADRRDDPSHARGPDGVGARRRLAMVRAGLEGHDQRSAPCLVACGNQRVQLRMGAAEFGMPPFGDDVLAAQHDGTDDGIRRNAPPAAPGELEGAAHRVELSISIFLQTEPSQRSHAPAGFRR